MKHGALGFMASQGGGAGFGYHADGSGTFTVVANPMASPPSTDNSLAYDEGTGLTIQLNGGGKTAYSNDHGASWTAGPDLASVLGVSLSGCSIDCTPSGVFVVAGYDSVNLRILTTTDGLTYTQRLSSAGLAPAPHALGSIG